MRTGFTIGEVRGVRITADFSWFFFLLVALYLLAGEFFPRFALAKEWGGNLQLATALIITLLFFLSVLAHELAHALVIRSYNLPVRGIMLYFFGGVTLTDGEPKSPKQEFRIAVIGPVVSLALAVAFFGLAAAFGLQRADPVPVSAWMLAILNFSMGAFNLLPGTPLDGGKVLHAAAWHFVGDPARADRIAAQGGRLLGYAVMGLGGGLLLLQIDVLTALFTVYVGWSMLRQATQGERAATWRRLLHTTAARAAMLPTSEQISPRLMLDEALSQFVVGRLSVESRQPLAVGDGGSPLGLITPAMMSAVTAEQRPLRSVREVMEPLGRIINVAPDLDLYTVLLRMEAAKASHAIVNEEGRSLGLVTQDSITQYIYAATKGRTAGPPTTRIDPHG